MSMLDGFEIIDTVSGVPSVSITKNGVSFNKSTIEKLHCPEYVVSLLDRTGCRFAIVPCSPNDRGARSFYKKDKELSYGVRWNNYDLRSTLETLMEWNLNNCGWKIAGTYSEADDALIFDLRNAEPLSRRNA